MNSKLVPIEKADYLTGRKLLEARGMRMAGHALLDEHISRFYRPGDSHWLLPAWARELIVHPEKNGKFRKGEDVIDPQSGWCLPACYLSDPNHVDKDVFRRGVGLFVEPEEIKAQNGRVVVIPASIIVLSPFIEDASESGITGKADEATRIPLAVEIDDDSERRILMRKDAIAVRPLLRVYTSAFSGMFNNQVYVCTPEWSGAWVVGDAAHAGKSRISEPQKESNNLG